MRIPRWFTLLLVLVLLGACTNTPTAPGGGPLPSPVAAITHVPDARSAASAFLDAWLAEDYASMYPMLDSASQTATSQDDFTTRYQQALATMSAYELTYEIVSVVTNPDSAQVTFRMTYRTALVGDVTREMALQMRLEDGQWHTAWDEGLILPELRGGNRLAMDYSVPDRGNIYDRKGEPIVSQVEAYALGLIPGQINYDNEGILMSELFQLTGLRPDTIRAIYSKASPDWYVPIGEVSADQINRRYTYLSNLGGLVLTPYTARYYHNGGAAPQSVGYVISIPAEEVNAYRRQGYSGNEKIGYSGIEKWAEPYLGGVRGGSLYVVNPQTGQITARLGRSDAVPASDITLTINKSLQLQAQLALTGFVGAAVVLERDTGRILAIVSSPGFDPNVFEPTNRNNVLLGDLLQDAENPLYNRATQGAYPLGSVFKIITFSAALDTGAYTIDTTYDCQYEFNELADRTLYDWTWDHCQDEFRRTGNCRTQPSGLLTLSEGLMRSCNPYFWHIGLDLYDRGFTTAVSDMARGFGLGSPTGIEQLPESSGNITDPTDGLVAVNSAIGQDPVLVTPLQVAAFIAAIGNGGTLYRPQMVERIQPKTGDPTLLFSPVVNGQLPVKPENLQALQQAMISVIENKRGTANFRLRNLDIAAAGKTGTAESGIPGYPHAWFAGYTYADIEGVPDIAIAVILENAGEGSEFAAPIFQRLVEIYFFGKPRTVYPWEADFYVTRTPTEPVFPTIISP